MEAYGRRVHINRRAFLNGVSGGGVPPPLRCLGTFAPRPSSSRRPRRPGVGVAGKWAKVAAKTLPHLNYLQTTVAISMWYYARNRSTCDIISGPVARSAGNRSVAHATAAEPGLFGSRVSIEHGHTECARSARGPSEFVARAPPPSPTPSRALCLHPFLVQPLHGSSPPPAPPRRHHRHDDVTIDRTRGAVNDVAAVASIVNPIAPPSQYRHPSW
ncbi:unnamed protein product, partial [Iphiclides podalirius]